MNADPITFVLAVNKRDVLNANFFASPCLQAPHLYQILLQEGFGSAALAYNDAIDKSINDLIVFCHQDMFFPSSWVAELQSAVQYLESSGRRWGVLGCSGVTQDRRWVGHVYSTGVGFIGSPSVPQEVQTLDEIVLVIRKSSGLRFDEALSHFHLYGSDICLQAAQKSMKSYAISAFCFHNTLQGYLLPQEFYDGCSYMRRKWRGSLPIQTTCVRITRFNVPIYWKRLREVFERHIRRRANKSTRVHDVVSAYQQLSASCRRSCS